MGRREGGKREYSSDVNRNKDRQVGRQVSRISREMRDAGGSDIMQL